jgi:hypothetical protein
MVSAVRIAGVLILIGLFVAGYWAFGGFRAPPDREPPTTAILGMLRDSQRLLIVVAHAEDVAFFAPLLAHAGGGSTVCLATGPLTSLEPAGKLPAKLLALGFPTAPASGDSRSANRDIRDEVVARWSEGGRDPKRSLVDVIRRVTPTVVVTFDPDQGYNGNNDHRALSRLVAAAVLEAADSSRYAQVGSPHAVQRLYFLVNRFPRRMHLPIPTISRSRITEIVSTTLLADGSAADLQTKVWAAFAKASPSGECALIPPDARRRLTSEVALVLADQAPDRDRDISTPAPDATSPTGG